MVLGSNFCSRVNAESADNLAQIYLVSAKDGPHQRHRMRLQGGPYGRGHADQRAAPKQKRPTEMGFFGCPRLSSGAP